MTQLVRLAAHSWPPPQRLSAPAALQHPALPLASFLFLRPHCNHPPMSLIDSDSDRRRPVPPARCGNVCRNHGHMTASHKSDQQRGGGGGGGRLSTHRRKCREKLWRNVPCRHFVRFLPQKTQNTDKQHIHPVICRKIRSSEHARLRISGCYGQNHVTQAAPHTACVTWF